MSSPEYIVDAEVGHIPIETSLLENNTTGPSLDKDFLMGRTTCPKCKMLRDQSLTQIQLVLYTLRGERDRPRRGNSSKFRPAFALAQDVYTRLYKDLAQEFVSLRAARNVEFWQSCSMFYHVR